MTGVPCSEALGGVPGGVLVSMESARPLDWRATRSVCAGLWSGVSFMAFFEEPSDSIADDSWAGSGTAMLRPSLNSVECRDSKVSGSLSELSLLAPECFDSFDRLLLDLKALLIRPTGEGDLLLEREFGGASPAGEASESL